MEFIMDNAAFILTAVGVVAAIVTIITELTKEIGFLAKIPTMLQVIVLSEILWILLYSALCSMGQVPFAWHFVVATLIAGVITAYVASYGWEKLVEIFSRYKKGAE